MAWKTTRHLADHYRTHRAEFPGFSIEDYDASAHETMTLGMPFDYVDPQTDDDHVGYFHRPTGRFTGTTLAGLVVTHFVTDEDYVSLLRYSTYRH